MELRIILAYFDGKGKPKVRVRFLTLTVVF